MEFKQLFKFVTCVSKILNSIGIIQPIAIKLSTLVPLLYERTREAVNKGIYHRKIASD